MLSVSYRCPRCGSRIFYEDKQCGHCSLLLEWEKLFVPVQKNINATIIIRASYDANAHEGE